LKKLALAYFSAVGSTKLVAELLSDILAREHGDALRIELADIEKEGARALVEAADFAVFLFPTYYLKPAPPMRAFVEGLAISAEGKPCYLVATCELYTENCALRLARQLEAKGYIVTGATSIRATGSDVTAALPSGLVPWLYRFGKASGARLSEAARAIGSCIEAPRRAMPRPRWYTPLSQLLQIVALNHFDLMRYRLRALEDRCTRCGLCARVCPSGALSVGETKAFAAPDQCILCCRCVHACPERALVLLKGLKDNPRIDRGLLGELKRDIRSERGLGAEETDGAVIRRKR